MSNQLLVAMDIERSDGTFEPLLQLGYRHIRRAEGLAGMRVRERKRPRPHGHGQRIRSQHRDSLPIVITADFVGENAERAWMEHDQVAGVLETATGQERLLRWTRGRKQLQRAVRLVELSAPIEIGPDIIRAQYTLDSEDPRAYSQVEELAKSSPLTDAGGGLVLPVVFPVTFGQIDGGVVTIDHHGSSSTPLLMLLTGYLRNPVIQLNESHRLVFDGDVAEGDVLHVDGRDRSVFLNGQANRQNLLRFADSRWFELPPQAVTSIRLLASEFSPGAGLQVRFRHAD